MHIRKANSCGNTTHGFAYAPTSCRKNFLWAGLAQQRLEAWGGGCGVQVVVVVVVRRGNRLGTPMGQAALQPHIFPPSHTATAHSPPSLPQCLAPPSHPAKLPVSLPNPPAHPTIPHPILNPTRSAHPAQPFPRKPHLPTLPPSNLPTCPLCHPTLLRPTQTTTPATSPFPSTIFPTAHPADPSRRLQCTPLPPHPHLPTLPTAHPTFPTAQHEYTTTRTCYAIFNNNCAMRPTSRGGLLHFGREGHFCSSC